VQRVLVVGYGNAFRGDDGFGPLAAGLVEERALTEMEVIVTRQLNPELALPLSRVEYAVFLDAAVGDEPGRLYATAVEPCGVPSGSHYFEPATLLALAQGVFGHAPPATLITATAATFQHGAEISPEVSLAASAAARAIAVLVASRQWDNASLSTALRRECASACTS
jgi:hydrogenase maturation protease